MWNAHLWAELEGVFQWSLLKEEPLQGMDSKLKYVTQTHIQLWEQPCFLQIFRNFGDRDRKISREI